MSEQASQEQGQSAPPEKETDNTTTEGQVAAAAPPNPAATPTVVTPSGKKGEFTQSDLNKAAGRARDEGRKVGSQELLSELGVDSPDTLRQIIQERQEAEEAKRTEAEKMAKERDKVSKERDSLKEELDNAYGFIADMKQETALKEAFSEAGVNPQRLGAALRLANTDDLQVDDDGNVKGIEGVIAQVQEQAPEFFAQAPRRVGSSSNPATEPPSAGPKSAWDMSSEEFERYAQEAKWGTHQINPFR